MGFGVRGFKFGVSVFAGFGFRDLRFRVQVSGFRV
jgi:hypothetical protein